MRVTRVAVAAVLSVACGGAEFDESAEFVDPMDAETFEETAEELSRAYDYRCTVYGDNANNGPTPIYLRLRGKVGTLSTTRDWSDATYGDHDPSYRGQSGKVRFRGFHSDHPGPIGRPTAMLATTALRRGGSTLRDGKKGGFVDLQYVGDTFGVLKYICKKTTGLAADENATPAPAAPTEDADGNVLVDGWGYPRAHAEAMLRACNELTFTELDVDVGLRSNDAHTIVDGRPYTTLQAVADRPGIAKAVMDKLYNWVGENGWVR